MFIGNFVRLTADANVISVPGTKRATPAYETGIKVYGHLGERIRMCDNDLDHCGFGITIDGFSAADDPLRWVARDNLAPSATKAVVGFSPLEQTGNVPA
jgi:hypothetical protein